MLGFAIRWLGFVQGFDKGLLVEERGFWFLWRSGKLECGWVFREGMFRG